MWSDAMRLLPLTLLSAFALTACATPENRVKTALLNAGVSEPVSSCMADRLTDKLSIAQLQKLARLARNSGPVRDMSLSELRERLNAVGDPEIVSVVTMAGIGCTIAG